LTENKPRITIGLPIYNGEKFIQSRLENILSQSFQDFNLIISDNASTDRTSKICKTFVLKDKRIQYFQQEYNIGGIKNFQFVLSKAKTEYFVFAAVDDMWDETFLEQNLDILEKDISVVGSIGKIEWSGAKTHRNDEFEIKSKDSIFQKIYKQTRKKFQHHGTDSISGRTFEERAAIFLRKLQTQNPSFNMYSIFRTNALQKSISPKKNIKEFYDTFWNSVCINVLEYGNIHLIDETLIYYNTDGSGSGVTPITEFKRKEISLIQCIIPWHGQTLWFIHKFGFKFFLKYFLDFSGLFIMGEIIFLQSVYKELKK
jgi:glycosyltransferase involved in cell wall biosynthesis